MITLVLTLGQLLTVGVANPQLQLEHSLGVAKGLTIFGSLIPCSKYEINSSKQHIIRPKHISSKGEDS
jgi:hypothetical protein